MVNDFIFDIGHYKRKHHVIKHHSDNESVGQQNPLLGFIGERNDKGFEVREGV